MKKFKLFLAALFCVSTLGFVGCEGDDAKKKEDVKDPSEAILGAWLLAMPSADNAQVEDFYQLVFDEDFVCTISSGKRASDADGNVTALSFGETYLYDYELNADGKAFTLSTEGYEATLEVNGDKLKYIENGEFVEYTRLEEALEAITPSIIGRWEIVTRQDIADSDGAYSETYDYLVITETTFGMGQGYINYDKDGNVTGENMSEMPMGYTFEGTTLSVLMNGVVAMTADVTVSGNVLTLTSNGQSKEYTFVEE